MPIADCLRLGRSGGDGSKDKVVLGFGLPLLTAVFSFWLHVIVWGAGLTTDLWGPLGSPGILTCAQGWRQLF